MAYHYVLAAECVSNYGVARCSVEGLAVQACQKLTMQALGSR
jgi:hypothetical protein